MAGRRRDKTKKLVKDSCLGFCSYCFKACDKLTIDHIIPKCRGGTNHENNLTAACYGCNDKKGSMHLIVFIAKMAGCEPEKAERLNHEAENLYNLS